MLTRSQEKIIRSLHTKKGRQETGLCLVEGAKSIETAGSAIQYTFEKKDTSRFDRLMATETPQELAGVAKIPTWTNKDIMSRETIVVLDGVQDPGNTGSILRLCLGFEASLILIESADPTSPKVIRSSVGAMFSVPWMKVSRARAVQRMKEFNRPIFRLEKKPRSSELPTIISPGEIVLIAGSEGSGIRLHLKGTSITIPHNPSLESLNVGHAIAIALHARYASLHP